MPEIDIHSLIETKKIVQQRWILDVLPEDLKELGQYVLFTLQNCYYNKNRLIKEITRLKEGASGPDDATKKSLISKIPDGKALHLQLPLTIWAYIPLFELHSFTNNIVRSCNHLAEISRTLNGLKQKRAGKKLTMAQYYYSYGNENDKLSKIISDEFTNWISKLNDKRNKVQHESIERQMKASLKYKLANKDGKIKTDIRMEIIAEQEMIEEFVLNTMKHLEKFIERFFLVMQMQYKIVEKIYEERRKEDQPIKFIVDEFKKDFPEDKIHWFKVDLDPHSNIINGRFSNLMNLDDMKNKSLKDLISMYESGKIIGNEKVKIDKIRKTLFEDPRVFIEKVGEAYWIYDGWHTSLAFALENKKIPCLMAVRFDRENE